MNIASKKFWTVTVVAALALSLSSELAKAAIITQWSFNSTSSSNNSPAPSTGSGTAITLGMTNNYNAPGSVPGDDISATASTFVPAFSENLWRVRGGGTLPNGATSTNGWAIYNITSGTAHDGAPEFSQGMELDTSTVGYSNVQFSVDWYSTTQGIRDMQFQYNTNVSNSAGWTNLQYSQQNLITSGSSGFVQDASGSNGVFVAAPNDYYTGNTSGQQNVAGTAPTTITINLSSITGANNDANFGIRLVSAFDDTGHLQDYAGASISGGVTTIYNNSSGNWRFGNMTFQGALALNTSSSAPLLTWGSSSGTWDTNNVNTPWLNSGTPSSFTNGYAVTFGSVSSGTSTISVAPGGVQAAVINVANTTPGTGYVFTGGAISGSGALNLTSSNVGFVSVSGTNSYSGGTQVSGGTLIVAGDASLGASNGAGGAVVLDNGSTLKLASGLSSQRIFETGPNGGVVNTNGFNLSTGGNFFGGGAYTQLGSGTVSFSGQSIQMSGSATVSAGALAFSGSNGAKLQGGGTFTGNLVINGPTAVSFDQTGGSSGSYGGSGQIQVPYAGSTGTNSTAVTNAWATITNSPIGSSTLTGGTVANGGTISNNIALNSASLPFAKTDVTAAKFGFPASNAFIAGIGPNGGTLTVNGNISGNSDVVLGSSFVNGQGGAGLLILGGTNTWTGTTMIDGAATVQLNSANALPATTDVAFGATDSSSTILNLNGINTTINSLSEITGSKGVITNATTGTNCTLTISGSTTPANAFSGTLTGSGGTGGGILGFTKNGTGGISLTGKNTFTGAANINQGTVTIASTSPFGTGALIVGSSANIIYSGAAVTIANSTASFASGSTLGPTGTAAYGTLTVTKSLSLNGGSLTYDLNTTQSDLLTGGTLGLGGASPGSIVINLNTTGQLFNTYPLFTFSKLSVTFNASDFTMGTGTTAGYTYSFTNPSGGTVNLVITGTGSNNLPTRQTLAWNTGSGNWDTASSSSTNWSPNTQFYNGDGASFPEPTTNGSTVSIASGGVTPLSLAISNTTNSYTFTGGPIAGTTGLTKTGTGVVTLATSNSYTGGTTLSGGTLIAGAAGDSVLGASSGSLTISGSATYETTTSSYSGSRGIAINTAGSILASTGTSTISGGFLVSNGATFTKTGTGTMVLSGAGSQSNASSNVVVQAGNLSIVPDSWGQNGNAQTGLVNIQSGASLTLNTSTPTTKSSSTFNLAGGTINGNLVITNPLTLSYGSAATVSGTGSVQFQNMQTPAQVTHFTTASGQGIQVSGGPNVTVNVNNNIQLNSLNSTFYKTSVTQAGSGPGGTGFQLGNGTTDSFFSIYPGAGNTMNINSVISGSCDVQFGSIGGGGQANNIYLNNQNTYSGVTMFEQGVNGNVILGASNALPTTTDLIFAPVNGNAYSQKLDLAGHNQTVASISYWAYGGTDPYGYGTSTQIQVVNSISTAATLTVSGAVSPSRPFGGVLGDNNTQSLILVKDGPNTLWLNGNNSGYTGGTTVLNGLLLVSPSDPVGGSPLGFGPVTVNGGTLQGSATIQTGVTQGNLVVGAAGTVEPGLANSMVAGGKAGTLTVSNNATFASGAAIYDDLGASGGSATSLLAVTNVLNLPASGSVYVDIADVGNRTGDIPLLTFGSLTGGSTTELTLRNQPSGATYQLVADPFNSNQIDVAVTPGTSASATVSGGTTSWSSSLATSKSTQVTLAASTSGASTITLDGPQSAGSLTFTNPANSAINLTAGYGGSLTIGNSASAGIVLSGGSDSIAGPLTLASNLTITGSGGVLSLANISQANSGTSLTLNNPTATLILSGANTYNGGTFVLSGNMNVASPSAIQSGSNLTVGSPAEFGGIQSAGGGVSPVPEPSTIALLTMGAGIAGWSVARRRLRGRRTSREPSPS